MKIAVSLIASVVAMKGERCAFSDHFVRHCADALHHYYDITADECLHRCNADSRCEKAHHHPGNQIWAEDDRTSCWLWDADAKPCAWEGGQHGAWHPGASMIWCKGAGK